MKTKKLPDSSIIKIIKKWKKDQGIESLTFDELKKEIKNKKLIIEQKVDGQSAILDYKKGQELKFGSLGGLIYTELDKHSEGIIAEIEKNPNQSISLDENIWIIADKGNQRKIQTDQRRVERVLLWTLVFWWSKTDRT